MKPVTRARVRGWSGLLLVAWLLVGVRWRRRFGFRELEWGECCFHSLSSDVIASFRDGRSLALALWLVLQQDAVVLGMCGR